MVVEGLVTTLNEDGSVNVSPMGPLTTPTLDSLTLRPFEGSRTLDNLRRHPECVFHVTDDSLLLTRAMLGRLDAPEVRPAEHVKGFVLSDACRWFELRVTDFSDERPRLTLTTEIVHQGIGRPFFGWNRAKHAVVEAAVLASRVHILPRGEILSEFDRLESAVEKTGGPDEFEAFDMLREHVHGAVPSDEQAAGRL